MGGSAASAAGLEDELPAGEDPGLVVRYFAALNAVAVADGMLGLHLTPQMKFKFETTGVNVLKLKRTEDITYDDVLCLVTGVDPPAEPDLAFEFNLEEGECAAVKSVVDAWRTEVSHVVIEVGDDAGE